MSVITYKYRVKDKHCAELNRQARAVNFVWNFCNDTQKHALKWQKKWPTGFELSKLTSGTSKELGLASGTIGQICLIYERSRRQTLRPILRYRGQRSLGWVPYRAREIYMRDGGFIHKGKRYDVWNSRAIPPGVKLSDSSFNQDARGRWYINVMFEMECNSSAGTAAVGIDLGLKDFAALSSGEKIEAQRVYRDLEPAIAVAQRARKKGRIKNLHAKVANRRKDFHHKLSTALVEDHGAIFVGNVDASKLMKTRMAKSVSDAGWTAFRKMLEQKAITRRVLFLEVNEAYSTQTCSSCGSRDSQARPRGIAGLGIRGWTCECGAVHDRDVNAARNILAAGHRSLEVGAAS